jgi:hypothetical protein
MGKHFESLGRGMASLLIFWSANAFGELPNSMREQPVFVKRGSLGAGCPSRYVPDLSVPELCIHHIDQQINGLKFLMSMSVLYNNVEEAALAESRLREVLVHPDATEAHKDSVRRFLRSRGIIL